MPTTLKQPREGRLTMTQSKHKAYNAIHYPGTRQLCYKCGEPTDRCEEDTLWDSDGNPLCETCCVHSGGSL